MKIYTIIVYKPSRESFSASLGSSFLNLTTDPFEKEVRDLVESDNARIYQMILNLKRVHKLQISKFHAYARSTEDGKVSIFVSDEEVGHDQRHKFLINVGKAESASDLRKILSNPDAAMKTEFDMKVERVLKQTEEVKDVMRENIKKVLDRGDALEDLQAQTEELMRDSKAFRDSGNRLKESIRCPGMWSLLTPIANAYDWLTGSAQVKYEQESLDQEKRAYSHK